MANRYLFLTTIFLVFGFIFCAIATSAQAQNQTRTDSLNVHPAVRQHVDADSLDADARAEIEAERERFALPARLQRIDADSLDADARAEIEAERERFALPARLQRIDADSLDADARAEIEAERERFALPARLQRIDADSLDADARAEIEAERERFALPARLQRIDADSLDADARMEINRLPLHERKHLLDNVQSGNAQMVMACDLDLTSLSVSPNPAFDNEDITITVGTINNGTARCSSEKISYYLSTNDIISTQDIFIGDDTETLDPGASDSEDITFKPQDLGVAPGTYWVGIIIDSENEAWISSFTLTIDPAPSGSCDLDISLMMLNPNPVAEDQDLTITVGTTNNGTANCTSEDVEYYLSTNATLTTSDILVGTDVETATLAPGESDSEDITFKPQDLGVAPGTYWVGVRVVSENEFFVASGTLTIDPAPSGSCDLDISLMMLNPNPVAEDQDLTITVGTTNNGTANCTSEDIEYYLSTNATLTTSDILVGTDVETATLAPGESDSEDITFKPQDLGVAPGTYWVGVRVVSENEFFVASGTLTIDPAPSGSCDLDISLMMLNPNPVAEDQDLTITVGTTNNGTANCTSEDIEYYLSTNATLTTSDILVGTDVETATLAPGESDSEDITFKPQDLGVAPGTYWVGVRVVSENEFFVASGTLTIDPAPSGSCDLDISLMMLNPNPVAEDQDLTITVGTTNNGMANCTSEDIEYYLSTNATLTTSDILVGTDVETATLAPGESDSEDITFKPQDLGVAPGTYWVGVRVVSENEFFVASGTLTIDPAVGNGALVGVALPSLSCGIDDDLTVPVMINDDVTGLSIIAYDFVLSFDPSIIDLSNVSTAGTLSNGWTLSSNTTSGQISVSAASSTELSGSGDLIFLTGKCLSEGTSPLTWISFTFNEGSPSASLTDGSVNVSSCPTCGDVSGNGTVSAFDASLILQYNVGILPPEQDFFSCAADVSGNGTISSFDAAQILQYNVGIISDLSCTGSASKTPFEQLWGSLEYGSPGFDHSSGRAFLPIHINPALDNLVSLEGFLYLGGAGSSILNIRKNGLPDGWMVSHSTRNDTLYFSMAGSTPLTDDSFFEVVFSDDNLSLKEPVSLSIRANEYGPVLLDHANLSTMIPSTFKLFQNYPNPFNPTTSISFLLPEPTQVTLEVFDLLGRRVHALIRDEEMPAGKHSVVFRGDELSSGIYIYRITAGNYREQRMFILQK